MLLQQLVAYANTLSDAVPSGYQRKPVRYLIDLTTDGRALGITDLRQRPKDRGLELAVPFVKRSGGNVPMLYADYATYTIGMPREKDTPAQVAGRFGSYRELAARCAEATGEPAAKAISRFLDRLPEGLPSLPADFDPSAAITFEVEGVRPVDLSPVQRFWQNELGGGGDASAKSASTDATLECLICGRRGRMSSKHPVPIKGIFKGNPIGTNLISANDPAYFSYGLEDSLISPTCEPCAEAYANGLNALLKNPATHLRLTEVEYCFWTAAGQSTNVIDLFNEPTSEEARRILESVRAGRASSLLIDPRPFYALALSGNGGRTVVLDWIDSTLGRAHHQIGQFFDAQTIAGEGGEPGSPRPLWMLSRAMVRTGSKDAPPRSAVAALVRCALAGTPPPLDLLSQAVLRCRVEQGKDRIRHERAALIKLVLVSRGLIDGEGGRMESLDVENRDPAYLCGRLLAILDAIQRQALGNPNTTIIDRFYGAASSAPASVFGTLMRGAQPHLAKLRKDRPGAYAALNDRLEQVTIGLTTFPSTLTLQQQGLFALGFYHQRGEDRRQARERAAARNASADAEAAIEPA